jgi:OOP family OmpA-OmpF porin
MSHRFSTPLMCVALLMGCTAAQAQGPYALVSVGNSTYMGNAQNDGDAALTAAGQTGISSSLSTRGTGYKALLGYQLSPSFAVEGGYWDIGNLTKYQATASGGGLSVDYKGMGLNASALGLAQVNNELSVFGKLGLTYSSVTGSGSGTGMSVGSTEEKASLGYGVGGIYNLTPKLGLRAEWERLYTDVTLFSVGLQVKF